MPWSVLWPRRGGGASRRVTRPDRNVGRPRGMNRVVVNVVREQRPTVPFRLVALCCMSRMPRERNSMTQPSPTTDAWIAAFRASHDRLVGLLEPLDAEGIRAESYDTGWPIAQVASHLGSQAEIFDLFLDAGLSGGELPGSERFQEIWGQWDSSTAERQVARSIEANESFVSRIEGLDAEQRTRFRANLFGNPADLSGLLAMRLAEHALHTWDVAVALDPTATVAPDAVELITDATLGSTVRRGARPSDSPAVISVNTTESDSVVHSDHRPRGVACAGRELRRRGDPADSGRSLGAAGLWPSRRRPHPRRTQGPGGVDRPVARCVPGLLTLRRRPVGRRRWTAVGPWG